MQIDFTKLKRY